MNASPEQLLRELIAIGYDSPAKLVRGLRAIRMMDSDSGRKSGKDFGAFYALAERDDKGIPRPKTEVIS